MPLLAVDSQRAMPGAAQAHDRVTGLHVGSVNDLIPSVAGER